jgi:hypothetical protein
VEDDVMKSDRDKLLKGRDYAIIVVGASCVAATIVMLSQLIFS